MGWIEETRQYMGEIFSKLPDLRVVGKEAAIELLISELDKIPIPLVGTLLSKMVKCAFESENEGGPEVGVVLEILQEMQESNDGFRAGLTQFGEDTNRLAKHIEYVGKLIAETKEKLTTPKLIISEPELQLHYPISDNEFSFGLMNIGGGALKVPEIEMRIENWEAETEVDYTIPAAPPQFLRLKVRLSPNRRHYPLLKLNNEPYRRFGAFSEGAEDICVQMSSETNARYQIRIQIPYKDADTGKEGKFLYPPTDEKPLEVPFCYAPGWSDDVMPETMLARAAVLSNIETTFSNVTLILAEATPSNNPEDLKIINEKINQTGIPIGIGDFPGLTTMLSVFTPPLARMAQLEHRPVVLQVILRFAHQLARYCPPDPMSGHPPIDALCEIVGKPELADDILMFFLEQDEFTRNESLTRIVSTI